MKKYKKPLLIVLLILLTPFLVKRNLYKHSAYYAQYTPHREGIEPVPIMLIDHSHDIHRPLDDIGAYCYEHGYYIRRDYKGAEYVKLCEVKEFVYYYHSSKNKEFYFDKDFNLIDSYYKYYKSGKPSDEEVAEAKKEMTDAFLPVVKRRNPPLLNLQWIFDWLYHERFN